MADPANPWNQDTNNLHNHRLRTHTLNPRPHEFDPTIKTCGRIRHTGLGIGPILDNFDFPTMWLNDIVMLWRTPIAKEADQNFDERTNMNWDQIKGKWKQARGQVKQQWGKLTDDELDVIDGKRDELVGKVQVKYGIAKEEAEKQVKEFESSCNC